jgi:hypothetical protein
MSHRTPISIAVTKVRCIEETDEVDSDEPFIVIFVADVARRIAIPGNGTVIVPSCATTIIGPWNDADSGELLTTVAIPANIPRNSWETFENTTRTVLRKPVWGLDGRLAMLRNPDDVIILVAIVEEDSVGHESLRGIVHGEMVASVNALINQVANGNLSRADMIAQLRHNMDSAIDAGRKTSIPDFSEQVGRTQELRLTNADLDIAGHGSQVKNLTIGRGGDDGKYRVRFVVRNRSFLG